MNKLYISYMAKSTHIGWVEWIYTGLIILWGYNGARDKTKRDKLHFWVHFQPFIITVFFLISEMSYFIFVCGIPFEVYSFLYQMKVCESRQVKATLIFSYKQAFPSGKQDMLVILTDWPLPEWTLRLAHSHLFWWSQSRSKKNLSIFKGECHRIPFNGGESGLISWIFPMVKRRGQVLGWLNNWKES